MPNSVITGVTGQDGAYLARQLLARGHTVFGGFRRTSSVNFWRLQELGILDHPALRLVEFDIIDPGACLRLIDKAAPECVYNLAAQSFVGVSFDEPVATAQMTAIGPLHLLEAIRQVNPKSSSIRRPRRSFTAGSAPVRKTRRRHSTRAAPMRSPSCSATGSRSIIAKPTAFRLERHSVQS